jgi:hypothetical protein
MAGQHEKWRQYNSMRIEGRELRANLQSLIRDLGMNVRIMTSLPPIQEIIDARSDMGQDPRLGDSDGRSIEKLHC